MPRVFSYGSLQQPDVQQSTYGRTLHAAPDALPGFALDRVTIADPARAAAVGRSHHANVVVSGEAGASVSGAMLEITDEELVRTDAYEAADDYVRQVVTLASGHDAWVYVHAPTTAAARAMPVAGVAEQATFFRAALWLGLVRGTEIVAWADRLLLAAPDAPSVLAHLSAVHEHDVTGLRHALLPLGPERPPAPVVHAVLGLAGRQLAAGQRGFDDTCTVLIQFRQWLPVSTEIAEELKSLELRRMGALPSATARDHEVHVRAWLSRFAGAETAFVGG